jgi:hypothetical protein
MKLVYTCILFVLSTLIYIPSTYAQQNAVTDDGRKVILYMDGSWEYLHTHEHHPEEEEESGRKAHILLGKDIMIYLDNGQLADFSVQSKGPRLYDNMNGKLNRIGRYDIEYDFHTDRVKKIGSYAIEYDFHTNRVKKIGDYPIEYDFHTGKISRVGNTRFEYSFFHGKLTNISGDTPGVKISLY